ncbi:DUF262 domain-containing protein [Azohydromonas australica]|uniref:DUF262 domain-containing protein n=1 Tax=Azohydromonas australica TaxID=364039 RepID=UPI0009FEBC84|nr:DUF262 domain-containing protein [Azohydromonas australica]
MKVESKVLSLEDVLGQNLSIPPYQRPYRWQRHHVSQLIDDLVRNRHKQAYRLGTVVLHQYDTLDIVDGQQRLVTLTMLCKALSPNSAMRLTLLNHHFMSPVAIRALQRNFALIQHRVQQISPAERSVLRKFLVERCEVVCIKLNDIGEAFQFFDSQNARGKDLFPHDLLKAFHLREMQDDTEEAHIACVKQWEEEVRNDQNDKSRHGLRAVLGDVLYPLRQWCAGESGSGFNREVIGVFKGVNLHRMQHPFVEPLRQVDLTLNKYPFQINQPIINGRRFFEYVKHYLMLYRRLFSKPHPQLENIIEILDSYPGRNRPGDHYIRDLFCAALLFYYDKFGEHELKRAAELCFVWSYRLRMTLQRVAAESIDNAGLAHNGLIRTIRNAINPEDVLSYMIEPLLDADVRANANKIKALIEKFKELGYLHA